MGGLIAGSADSSATPGMIPRMSARGDGGPPSRRSGVRAAVATLAAVAASPALYPLWLAIEGRRRAAPVPPTPGAWPPITVVVPAYREQAVIAAKIADTRADGYPGELELIVVADDPDTASAARAAGATVIEPGIRRGKATAVNLGLERASGALFVF